MSRPEAVEYAPYFEHYVSLAKGNSVTELIMLYSEQLIQFVDALPDEKANYKYAHDKWALKEVVQHLLDTERIFAYRALAISRGETQILPGFDPTAYGKNQRAMTRSFDDLKEEYKAVRYATNMLFRSFDMEALRSVGLVGGSKTSCRAWIYISFGHALHHMDMMKKNYL